MTSEIMRIVGTTKGLSLDTSIFTVSLQMVKNPYLLCTLATLIGVLESLKKSLCSE